MMSYTGREPVFLLSFISSDSFVSNSFTILSPSPLLGVETRQQVQATSDRSRISTKACSPITCVTGCATKSQLTKTLIRQDLSLKWILAVQLWVPGLLLAAVNLYFGQIPTFMVIGQYCRDNMGHKGLICQINFSTHSNKPKKYP